ncbi:unnamed protein product [Onchocerca flexuosa]|uniref:Uncharacterized protein n=2 Tax=Onchocerca flexuosa TaxID=387005 RepID=A0A183H0A6_9BILA|nr:unnamed protein product [Onchocerca flexuosa]
MVLQAKINQTCFLITPTKEKTVLPQNTRNLENRVKYDCMLVQPRYRNNDGIYGLMGATINVGALLEHDNSVMI